MLKGHNSIFFAISLVICFNKWVLPINVVKDIIQFLYFHISSTMVKPEGSTTFIMLSNDVKVALGYITDRGRVR